MIYGGRCENEGTSATLYGGRLDDQQIYVRTYVDEDMWKSVRRSTDSTNVYGGPCEDPRMEVGAKIHESKRSYMEVGVKIPLEIVGRA